ncbi:MAG: GNAT family N-acetyltransferase [Candidatus Izemoplasmataceae bacterium]
MIRRATKNDLDAIDRLAERAIKAMQGAKIHQWDFSYPRKPHFFNDVEKERLYVFESNAGILGVMAILEDEPLYDVIDWHRQGALVIHRMIVGPDAQRQGVASAMMMHAIAMAKNRGKKAIHIDTHPGNPRMKNFLRKHQFHYRGYLKSIHRLAYERLVDFSHVRRVSIFGSSGTGKTTLARMVGAKFNLPVLHLDTIYWKQNWTSLSKPEFKRRIRAYMRTHPRFVMDGNYTNSQTFEDRLKISDTLILLRYDTRQALKGILEREAEYKHRYRSDMATGCIEDVDQEFLQYVAFFHKKKLKIEGLLNQFKDTKTILIFDNREALQYWLDSI